MALNSSPLELLNFNKGHHSSDIQIQGVDDGLGSFGTCNMAFPYHLSDSKDANYALTPDNWSYSSSSVLNFDRPSYYSSPDEEECDLWIDTTMNQNNPSADQYEVCLEDANIGHQNPIRKDGINGSRYGEEPQLMYMYASMSSVDSVQDNVSQKCKQEVYIYNNSMNLLNYFKVISVFIFLLMKLFNILLIFIRWEKHT